MGATPNTFNFLISQFATAKQQAFLFYNTKEMHRWIITINLLSTHFC